MLLGLQTYFICAVNYPSWTYLKHLYLFCVGIALDWWTGELSILKVSHSSFSCHSHPVFNFVHASIVNQVGSSLPKTRMKCQQNSLTKAEVYLASISSFCRIKGLYPIYSVSYLSYLSYIYILFILFIQGFPSIKFPCKNMHYLLQFWAETIALIFTIWFFF